MASGIVVLSFSRFGKPVQWHHKIVLAADNGTLGSSSRPNQLPHVKGSASASCSMLIKNSSFTPARIAVTAAVPRSVSELQTAPAFGRLPAPYQINPRPFDPSRTRDMGVSAKRQVPIRRQTARPER